MGKSFVIFLLRVKISRYGILKSVVVFVVLSEGWLYSGVLQIIQKMSIDDKVSSEIVFRFAWKG